MPILSKSQQSDAFLETKDPEKSKNRLSETREFSPATTNGSIPVISTVAQLVEHQAAAGDRDFGRIITQGLRISAVARGGAGGARAPQFFS